MPYRLSWYHENHVVFASVSGNFTVAEFEAYGEELVESYLDSAPHPIHIISDASQMERFPTQVWTAIRATEPWLRHRNLGWIILLSSGGNAMLRFLISAVNQVVGIRYHVVETSEEAYMLLQQLDNTLPELTLNISANQPAAPND
jgi:hypothetical protein